MKGMPSTLSASVFLLSGSALAYEVMLVRLLAVTRFHHLAFMVLSLALLGYGVSGVLLARQRARLLGSFQAWFSGFAAMFATGTVCCFQLSQRIPVFPGEWVWSPFEALHLAALYLVLSLPFLAAACGVGLAYSARGTIAGSVYRADLLGAAAGCLGALPALWLPEAAGLWLPWSGGFAASALMVMPDRKRWAALLVSAALLGPAVNPEHAVRLITSPDKPLSIALSAEGVEILTDIFTPIGRITVTRNRLAPYRYAPGLSLAFQGSVGAQWGAFVDGGEAFMPLPTTPERTEAPTYLDYLPEALAYRLVSQPRVLVLEAPAMEHLARAFAGEARAVNVVLSNPGWRTLFEETRKSGPGRYLALPNVHLTVGAPRGFLRSAPRRYDLIVIGDPAPSALTPDHLHTVEAFGEALTRLSSGGILSVSGPSDLPPRACLRLLATAAAALHMSGVTHPEDRLVMIRSLRTVQLMITNGPLTPKDIAEIRSFCTDRRFDPVWFPGIEPAEANRWNRIDAPLFHDGALGILGSASERFPARYKFDVSPVFDNRPYFSHFIKPATLMEILSLRESGALGMLSFAEPVLAATLLQGIVISILFVWLPLRRFRATEDRRRAGVMVFMLGMGFMLAEFAVMEQLRLFLNEPVLATAVTLAVFLSMAGLGGGMTSRRSRDGTLRFSGFAALLTAGILVVYITALPPVLKVFMGAHPAVRTVLAMVLISPLATAMGLPFPLAVSALKTADTRAVPWAWGLNGCGSMIGPVLGMSIAVYGGGTWVFGAAILCYGTAFAAGLTPSISGTGRKQGETIQP
jgi:hypothetical protein